MLSYFEKIGGTVWTDGVQRLMWPPRGLHVLVSGYVCQIKLNTQLLSPR